MAAAEPRGQQGRQYDQEQLESQLRDALRALMADGTSFRDLSVASIIEVAGVARSTFYTYFPDKSRMLMALSAHSVATRESAADVAGQPDTMKAMAPIPTAIMIREASRRATGRSRWMGRPACHFGRAPVPKASRPSWSWS